MMKRILILGFFVFSVIRADAGNIDSLYIEYAKATVDTSKAAVLLKIATELEKTDPQKSVKTVFEAYNILKKIKISNENIEPISGYFADAVRKIGAALFQSGDSTAAMRFFRLDNKVRILLSDTEEIVRSFRNIAYVFSAKMNIDSAVYYYDIAAKTALSAKLFGMAADMKRRKGIFYDNAAKSDSAINSFLFAAGLYEMDSNRAMEGTMYNLVGNQYKFRSEYEKALQFYQKSLNVKEEIKDTTGMAYAYIGIANVFINWGYYDKARTNYQNCLSLSEKNKNLKGVSAAYVGLANLFQREEKLNEALDYYQRSLVIEQMMNNSEGIALAQLNMADVYTKMSEFDKAISLYSEALKLMESDNNKVRTNLILYQIGNLYYQKNDFARAVQYFEKSMTVAKEIQYNQTILSDLEGLSNAWSEKGNFEKAYMYLLEFKTMNDSLFNEEKMKQVTEMQEKYESEKKEKELLKKDLELSEKEKEAGFERNMRNVFVAGFLIVIVFAFFVFRSYRQKKAANLTISQKNILLEQANSEIIAQRDEIESQRDMVMQQKEQIEQIHEEQTSSIRYALRIQNAMLPSLEILNNTGLDYFLIYRPRDIVSGDFYWVGRQENNLIITVADCTGHGVPGAFMSMLGVALLKEIVMKEYITQPDVILKKLRREIVRALKQETGSSQRDGMDIALCNINLDTLELQFSGANNPLYIVHSPQSEVSRDEDCRLQTGDCGLTEVKGDLSSGTGTLVEVKGDKMPIGIHERMDNFTLHTQQLQKGDYIYMFSDGIADQFGGPAGKKFKYKQLKELLVTHSGKSAEQQKQEIENTFNEWISGFDQVDDVTVIGLCV